MKGAGRDGHTGAGYRGNRALGRWSVRRLDTLGRKCDAGRGVRCVLRSPLRTHTLVALMFKDSCGYRFRTGSLLYLCAITAATIWLMSTVFATGLFRRQANRPSRKPVILFEAAWAGPMVSLL